MAMQLRIVCPETSAYEGEAAFVALPSTDGELGVAARHASEICTLGSGYIRVSDTVMGTIDHRFAVSGGYAQIADDEVIVLAERAVDVDAVDVARVQAKLQGFEDQLSVLSENDARRAYLYNEIAWCRLLLGARTS